MIVMPPSGPCANVPIAIANASHFCGSRQPR